MKVARSALHISLSLRERVGVRETLMAHATYIFRGGAGAMLVRLELDSHNATFVDNPLDNPFAL
jgi:hypothetical protein